MLPRKESISLIKGYASPAKEMAAEAASLHLFEVGNGLQYMHYKYHFYAF